MATDVLLINGASLPYHLLDKGIEHANTTGNQVLAVFVYQNNEDDDRYGIPSDIEMTKAEYGDSNAERNLTELIQHNAQFVNSYFHQKETDVQTLILHNPTIDDIVETTGNAEKIFLDPETFRHPDEFAYIDLPYEDLDERLSKKIEWCHATH